jgi:hypothetical protein
VRRCGVRRFCGGTSASQTRARYRRGALPPRRSPAGTETTPSGLRSPYPSAGGTRTWFSVSEKSEHPYFHTLDFRDCTPFHTTCFPPGPAAAGRQDKLPPPPQPSSTARPPPHLARLPDREADHRLVEALDDLAATDLELQGAAALLAAGVEDAACWWVIEGVRGTSERFGALLRSFLTGPSCR